MWSIMHNLITLCNIRSRHIQTLTFLFSNLLHLLFLTFFFLFYQIQKIIQGFLFPRIPLLLRIFNLIPSLEKRIFPFLRLPNVRIFNQIIVRKFLFIFHFQGFLNIFLYLLVDLHLCWNQFLDLRGFFLPGTASSFQFLPNAVYFFVYTITSIVIFHERWVFGV